MKPDKQQTILLVYNTIKKWEVISSVTLISIIVVLGVFYLHPANINWFENSQFSIINLLQFVFIDQFLIELITTAIISLLIVYYAKIIKINHVTLSFRGVAAYFLKFLPIYALAYFFTSPFTVTIRYMYHRFIIQQDTLVYFDAYFFLNKSLYLAYLLPITLICTLLLVIVIFKSSRSLDAQVHQKTTLKHSMLKVKTDVGESLINSNSISWFYREGRKYYAHTTGGEIHQINKSLSELQEELDINFALINRATLINIGNFENYSFWQNEKYIIRMKDGTEFNSTRKRIKQLKKQIDSYHKLNSDSDENELINDDKFKA